MTRAARAIWWLVLASLIGCDHPAPFQGESYDPGVPNGSGPLLRLTYNLGVDLSPSWLPDGSGFLYTEERFDRRDLDRCLARMPAGGGSIIAEICDRTVAGNDSVNAYSSAAVARDGRLAYVRASAGLGVGWPINPRYHELVVATLADPQQTTVLQRLSYLGPSGRPHDEVTHLQWLGDRVLVYVGQHVAYVPPCLGCGPDTLVSGLEIVRLDFSGATPVLTMLPGSDQASSVAVANSDTIYFTVNGNSRVFRLSLSTDSLAVVHDFGAGTIARDIQVAGRRLVAVVGGAVSFTIDSVIGTFQRDGGGMLVQVDLDSGVEVPLTSDTQFFRHPALSPDGTRVVAEQVFGRTTDLYLVTVP